MDIIGQMRPDNDWLLDWTGQDWIVQQNVCSEEKVVWLKLPSLYLKHGGK